MKRTCNVAMLAVAAAVLAACSSGDGSSSSTSSAASSPSAPFSASSWATSASSGSAGTASSTAVPAGLDAASTAWFDVLCTNMLAPLHNITEANMPTGPAYQSGAAEDNPTQQEADNQARIAALNQTVATLATTPPPGFDGGAAYASAVTTALQTTIQTLTADPAQGSDLSPSGPFHPLDAAISQVDPTVRNYAYLIPSCNAAGGLPSEGNPPATIAAPADLDAASTTWFGAFCTSLASMGGPGPSTPAELLAARQGFAARMTQTAATLAATPPPGFDGGAAWAASVIAVLQYSGETMTASLPQYAADLAALDPNDPAAFQAFKRWHAQPEGLEEGYGLLATMDTQLDPSIMAAVRAIPSCKSAGM